MTLSPATIMTPLVPHTGVTPRTARPPGGVNWGVVGDNFGSEQDACACVGLTRDVAVPTRREAFARDASLAAAAGETPAVTPIYRERRQQNSPVASIARMRVCRDYHRPGACSRSLSPATTESPRSVRGRHVGGVGANRNRTNLAPGHGAAGDPQTGFMLCPLETPRRRHFPQTDPTSRSRRHAAAHSLRAWLGHYNWLGTLFQDRVSA